MGQIGEFVDAQTDFGLFHGEQGLAHVGVAHQSGVNEGAQLRIGEDFSPREVAERSGVGNGQRAARCGGVSVEGCGELLGVLSVAFVVSEQRTATGEQ